MPARRKHPKPLRQPNTIHRTLAPKPPVSTSTSTEANNEVQGPTPPDMPAFPSGNADNGLAEDHVEQDPRQGEPQPPDQQFLPGGFPDVIPREPIIGVDKYAVGVETSTRVEPLVGIFDWQADYSCMLATVAETLGPGVRIRQTTPSQRNRWYYTPGGYIFNPQRYVELNVTAFDPQIPSVSVEMLLWEHASPINGVHVYLGNGMRTKLERIGVELSVKESGSIGGQTFGDGSTWLPDSGNVEYNGGIASSSDVLPSGELVSTLYPLQANTNLYSYGYSQSSQTIAGENTLFSEQNTHASSVVSSCSSLEPLPAIVEGTRDLNDSIMCGFTTCEPSDDHTIEGNQALDENLHLLASFPNWESEIM
ncbi:hypothetical protein GGR51DRAFT_524878 [Nemania sp. FL0031]|nr:hypothetical protein GGR51DRAFT_524878 [Nemania sp. FL0031]